MSQALQAYLPEKLAEVAEIPLECARRIHSAWASGKWQAGPIGTIRKESLAKVRALGDFPRLCCVDEVKSQLDPFVKYGFELADQAIIETVRIPLERPGRYVVCVSSQVGCPLACRFCATGRLGLVRNLATWEILEQVRELSLRLSSGRIHGVVFQGMGEPLANLDAVLEAIAILREPSGLAVDTRNITVSTAGLPAGILRLARAEPKVRLAFSVGSMLEGTRKRLMPIAEKFELAEVLDALRQHAELTGLAPLFAVTPLAGENDSFEEGAQLGRVAREFWEKSGVRPRISVIPYNSIGPGDPYQRPTEEALNLYAEGVASTGYPVHRRYSGGSDVAAACGQLAARGEGQVEGRGLGRSSP